MQIDKQITKRDLTQRILLYELIGFLLMTALILLDDVIDVPHLLRILPAPAKWIAIAFQIVVVIAMCSFVLRLTRSLLQRVKFLEGLLPVCSFCKKIRVGDTWRPIEEYLLENSEALLSHGFCPECGQKHYGDFFRKN